MGKVKAERLIAIDGVIVAELQAEIEVADRRSGGPEMRSRASKARNQIGHHKGDSGKISILEIRRASGKERNQHRDAELDARSIDLGVKLTSRTRKELLKAAFKQGSLENLNKALKRSEIAGRKARQFKSIEEFDAFLQA